MKKLFFNVLFVVAVFTIDVKAQDEAVINPMIQHPEWYINVTDWSFYAAFKVAIINNVTIENTSDIPYKDVMISVSYYSTAPSKYGTLVGQEVGVLPVTLSPHSKETYLKNGTVLGSGSSLFYAGDLQVLGAVPIIE
ncbi:MAG: hypothetical protein ACE5H1_05510 [Thermodesulfobacteriota bacterium]